MNGLRVTLPRVVSGIALGVVGFAAAYAIGRTTSGSGDAADTRSLPTGSVLVLQTAAAGPVKVHAAAIPPLANRRGAVIVPRAPVASSPTRVVPPAKSSPPSEPPPATTFFGP